MFFGDGPDTSGRGAAPSPHEEDPDLKQAWQNLRSAGRSTLGALGDTLRQGAKEFGEATKDSVRQALDWMAADPKIGRSGADTIVSILPIIGTSKLLADARAIYFDGKETGDEKKIHQGRKLCLAACISGGLDLSGLGVSALPGNNLGRGLITGFILRGGAVVFDTVTKGALSNRLDDALEEPRVSRAMDSILEGLGKPENRRSSPSPA